MSNVYTINALARNEPSMNMPKKYDHIDVKTDQRGVMTITLQRGGTGEKLNALNEEMVSELLEVMGEATKRESSVNVIVLRGTEVTTRSGDKRSIFSVGMDLSTLHSIAMEEDKEVRKCRLRPYAQLLQVMDKSYTPIIGVMDGDAVGLGVTLLACCDRAIAPQKDEPYQLSYPEWKNFALPPGLSMFYVMRRAGDRQPEALKWLTEGNRIDVAHAHDLNIIDQLVDSSQLSATLDVQVTAALNNPTGFMRRSKKSKTADEYASGPDRFANIPDLISQLSEKEIFGYSDDTRAGQEAFCNECVSSLSDRMDDPRVRQLLSDAVSKKPKPVPPQAQVRVDSSHGITPPRAADGPEESR